MGLRDFTVYSLVVRNARVFRNREAWIAGDRRITFQEFLNQTDCVAAGLYSGIRKGDRLGILSQNCFEFVLLYGAGRSCSPSTGTSPLLR
jgi:acyl-CoA synthetase (AMP-forming)/AMP-acid ligase II